MKIQVTQEHIDRGNQCESMACPIALAMTEALGIPVYVTPDAAGVDMTYGDDEEVEVELPELAQAFVAAFDLDRTGAPFAFDLPAASVRALRRAAKKAGSK